MAIKNTSDEKKSFADWLVSGALARIGDKLDRFSGRRSVSASSLATSELIARLTKLLDMEAREIAGKGTVVPHHIELRMQWDKFADDSDEKLRKLEAELIVSVIDHINDSRYYTYAPIELKVKPDYFVKGVKLVASFDRLVEDEEEAIMNVTVPFLGIDPTDDARESETGRGHALKITFSIDSVETHKRLDVSTDERISVGRDGVNELVINDPSVSKIHASLIVADGGKFKVADTGSTNGTFVNDVRIPYGKAVEFESTDRLKFGNVEVKFSLVLEKDEELEADSEIQRSDEIVAADQESDPMETISSIETESLKKVTIQPRVEETPDPEKSR